MIDILWNTASFIVALGVLVTIHEYGHFWVARKLDVKVLRFSIGFGKALWSKVAKDGTEYIVATIPLGGYVKMLDEREGDVAPEEKHRAFNNKSVGKRIAIVIAGPVANFLLAIFVYWWMFVIGVPAVKPYLGDVHEQSIAAEAGLEKGDEIISIDGKAVGNWEEVNHAIVRRLGENNTLEISVRHTDESLIRQYSLELTNWHVDPIRPDPLDSLGLNPWLPKFPPVLGDVLPEGAAKQAGLIQGDRILSINDQSIKQWSDIGTLIREHPQTDFKFEIQRAEEYLQITVKTGSREVQGEEQGFLGVESLGLTEEQHMLIENMRYRQQYGIFQALDKGIDKTWEITLLSFRIIGKIFSGEVSPKNLSGPISIAKGAGAYASYGFVFFLGFLGLISVNLGIINLLPIPVLDGGHLLYYILELVRGKPIPEAAQEVGYRIGMFLVLSLMIFSIVNDFSRL